MGGNKKKKKIMALQVCVWSHFHCIYLQLSTPNVFLINFEDGKSSSRERKRRKFIRKSFFWKFTPVPPILRALFVVENLFLFLKTSSKEGEDLIENLLRRIIVSLRSRRFLAMLLTSPPFPPPHTFFTAEKDYWKTKKTLSDVASQGKEKLALKDI